MPRNLVAISALEENSRTLSQHAGDAPELAITLSVLPQERELAHSPGCKRKRTGVNPSFFLLLLKPDLGRLRASSA